MPDEGISAMLQQKFCRIGVPVPASLKIDQIKEETFAERQFKMIKLHPVSFKYKILYYNNERKARYHSQVHDYKFFYTGMLQKNLLFQMTAYYTCSNIFQQNTSSLKGVSPWPLSILLRAF